MKYMCGTSEVMQAEGWCHLVVNRMSGQNRGFMLGAEFNQQSEFNQLRGSEMGGRSMALRALLALFLSSGSRASHQVIWRSTSATRDSRRAMSPSSRLLSAMACSHVAPDVQASTTPEFTRCA